MNYSTIQLFVQTGREILENRSRPGQEEQATQLPRLTRDKVFWQLSRIPAVFNVKRFHLEKANGPAKTDVEKQLKRYCKWAGREMLLALDDLESMRLDMGQFPDFIPSHSRFRPVLLHLQRCLGAWEKTIGIDAFKKVNKGPREVRKLYLRHSLRLILIVFNLVLPAAYDDWIDDFESFYRRADFMDQFILDSKLTYDRLRVRRPTFYGMLGRIDKMPRHSAPLTRSFCPRFVRNNYAYGNSILVNELCKLKGLRPDYLNLTLINILIAKKEGQEQSRITEPDAEIQG